MNDFIKIKGSGKNLYYIDGEFDMVELRTFPDFLNFRHKKVLKDSVPKDFKYVLFITKEKSEELQPLIKSIGNMKKLYDSKVETLFQVVKLQSRQK